MPKTQRLNFSGRGGDFINELDRQVKAYLTPAVKAAGFRRLYLKAAFIIAWTTASYVLLVGFAQGFWQVAAAGLSFVLGAAGLGFNLMHDGNHGAFSPSKRLNRIAGLALELLGGCSAIWKVEHNQMHHSRPNVDSEDHDIDIMPMARMASSQEYKPWYRWQHCYMWFLYGFAAIRWTLWGDFGPFFRRRIGNTDLQKTTTRELVTFAGGKLAFYGWAFVIPLCLHWSLHGAAMIGLAFLGLAWVGSLILTITFQLAHCADEARFVSKADVGPDGKLQSTWAEHQVAATTDFCPNNRLITAYVGGLNFQVEHHLYPEVSHVHYPAIAKLVQEACRQHGYEYHCQPTLRGAIASHYRHLRNMAQPPQAATV